MTQNAAEPFPVVASETFILATRDTGYRNTAAAVAELIDNSLQAKASRVDVRVADEVSEGRRIAISVLDDGVGMDWTTLRRSLQFGGSQRFNDRSGSGRFGMGLPNSSLSQSQRVEVYSWQDGKPLHTYLDVQEIAAGRCDAVPAPVSATLPDWTSGRRARTGTLVVWPSCDRLGYRRASTVAAKLRTDLGRIYRYALWQGVRITVNDGNLEPIDPLLSRGSCPNSGAETVGDTLEYEIRAPADPQVTSVVRVRFSILPVAAWASRSSTEKRQLGVTGRAGVSIVRAGREIDYGWYLMGEKRKENYDDWWRCEVAFEPALDEYFRVTHSKQGVTPHPRLAEMISPDIEQMARLLNGRVRDEFRRISRQPERIRDENPRPRGTKESSASRLCATTAATRRERFLPPLRRLVRRYVIRSAPVPSGRFFMVRTGDESAVVTVNTNHPFYEQVYAPARAKGKTEQFLIEAVILAAARAELAVSGESERRESYVESWSDALAAFLTAR
jgi:histidine kinase/DNA gyrase B/HSP90-like ATPase